MKKIVKKSPVPLYSVAALWVIWALLFPMYRLGNFIVLTAVSLLLYKFMSKLFKGKIIEVEEPKPEPKPEEKPKPAGSGNPEIDKLMREGDRAISEMRRLNESIKDETISRQINEMENATIKIFDHVMQNPNKLPQIRRFLNYYLPTSLKILNAYDRMGEQGIHGENIDGTMGKIEAILETIVQAFHKQLDALFREEALDIATDIKVMETLLVREGIGGTRMETGS